MFVLLIFEFYFILLNAWTFVVYDELNIGL